MLRNPAWAPLCVLLACSSSTGTGAAGPSSGDDLDGAVGPIADGAGNPSMPSSDAPSSAGDAGTAGDALATGTAPTGKAGADAFCTQICDHEQHCATVLDASAAGLSTCFANCQSGNEAPMGNPPTELLRADYIAALGACIAGSSCDDALATSESACASSVVAGSGGGAPLVPTSIATAFCNAFLASPCAATDAGPSVCLSAYGLYSDATLSAARACLSMSSCADADSCFTAAVSQT